MSSTDPCFQLIGDRFSGGEYGITEFGLAPFGGPDYPPYVLPHPHVPSDGLSVKRHHVVREVVKRRNGVVIAARTEVVLGLWHVRFHALWEADVNELSVFHKARRFKLLPAGEDGGTSYTVFWTDPEFHPEPIPGEATRFNLEFDIEEMPS